MVRYIVGELTVRMCSGLFHRLESIKEAAMKYDYTPYVILKPGEEPFSCKIVHSVCVKLLYNSLSN